MLHRIGFALLLIIIFLLSPPGEAFAEKRVALIIGNSAYKNVTKLPNPVKDSTAVAEMFKKANFDVVESRQDLGINEMKRALRDFADKVQDADIAVLFYAGHGIEVDGMNYLVPVDAALETDRDVEDEAISLDRILRVLDPAKRLRLVILDACRDNPLARTMKRTMASRSVGRGLAKVEPTTSDTLIAFAAKAGSTASDGDAVNSPFTTALLKNVATPGLDLRIAFGRVRDDVLKTTSNKQEPFVYGSLGGTTVALVPVQRPPAQANQNAAVRRDYEAAERIGTKEAWASFLAVHKTGLYADLARSQLLKLGVPQEQKPPAQVASAAAPGAPPNITRSAPSNSESPPSTNPPSSSQSASLTGFDGMYHGQVCYGEAPNVQPRCFQSFAPVEGGKINKQWVRKDTGYTTVMTGEVTASGEIKIQIRGHFPDGRPGAIIDLAGKIQNNRLDVTGSFANGRPAEMHWAKE